MSTRFIKRRSAARVVGEAREPRLHTVAEARRISRKSKRLGLLAVQPAPVQRQEEEVLAVGEEEEDHLHAGGMRLVTMPIRACRFPASISSWFIVVEEFVGRMRLSSGRPAACQQALGW